VGSGKVRLPVPPPEVADEDQGAHPAAEEIVPLSAGSRGYSE